MRKRDQVHRLSDSEIAALPPILSSKDVAGILGLSVRTVSTYAREGIIPASVVGRSYRYRRDEILSLIGLRFEDVIAAGEAIEQARDDSLYLLRKKVTQEVRETPMLGEPCPDDSGGAYDASRLLDLLSTLMEARARNGKEEE